MKKVLFSILALISINISVASAAGSGYMCRGNCEDEKDMRKFRTVYAETLESAQQEMERVCGEDNVDLEKIACVPYLF